MNALQLASSEGGIIALLLIGGIVLVGVIIALIAYSHNETREEGEPRSRVLGFAPRDLPEPESDIPDRIRPIPDEMRRRAREGPVEPPPDLALPAPPPKLLPPGNLE